MKLQAILGAAIGVSLLSISPLWAQSLEKIGEGAKKEGKLKVGLTVRWEEAGKPGRKNLSKFFKLATRFSRSSMNEWEVRESASAS